MANKHVNAVIVGAGAGGGVVAKELSEAGLTVVLLERGAWSSFEEIDHDELRSQIWYAPMPSFGPDDEKNFRLMPAGKDLFRKVTPNDISYGNIAGCVGSGTVTYGAMAWRFPETDFRMRSTYGAVEGSTLADWPITYNDLEPFYEKAEWEIGVAGDDARNPFAPPRKKAQPMPPHPYNLEGQLLEAGARKLGLHPFPIPMARNSVPYGGRPACIHCSYCCGFACEVNAKNGTHNTVIPRALQTGNCELRTGSVASEIVVDDRGRARAVKYFDGRNRSQTQSADIIIISCAAVETARLLLNSRSKLFPNGAGNNNDWVGRNLQGHAYSGAWGLFDRVTFDSVGSGATIAIADYVHHNPGLKSGAVLCNEFIRLPYGFSMVTPPGLQSWGRERKRFQREFFKRSINVKGPVQEMPVFNMRVEVDPASRDYWGIPVSKISGTRHPNDVEVGKYIAARAEEWLKAAGAVKTWGEVPGLGGTGGQHQAGTCRMGNDPGTSVTNRFGQIHEIDNLFVADGSLHVTNGCMNPALTIMALGYWVANYIKNEWRGTGFRS